MGIVGEAKVGTPGMNTQDYNDLLNTELGNARNNILTATGIRENGIPSPNEPCGGDVTHDSLNGCLKNGSINYMNAQGVYASCGPSCTDQCSSAVPQCQVMQTATCQNTCTNMIMSLIQNPLLCQYNPSMCQDAFNDCMSSCTSAVQGICEIQYNQCIVGCQ